MTRYLLLPLLLLCLAGALALAAPVPGTPLVFWYSDPLKPGELVLLQGANFAADATVEFARVPDGPPGAPQAAPAAPTQPVTSVMPMLAGAVSVKAVVPADFKMGIVACRVVTPAGTSAWQYLNSPQAWWQQGDVGAEASPGGWLRVFGRCLSFNGQATVVLRAPGQPDLTLKPVKQECWSLSLELPATCPAGAYQVWVHNGFGGAAGWRQTGTMKIAAHAPFWKTDRFNLVDYGAVPDDERDDTLAFQRTLDAVAANAGGTILIPRGRFLVRGGFVLPAHTLVQGVTAEQSVLEWSDMTDPPEELIHGSDNFALQDLGIYVQNHRWGIVSDEKGAGNIYLRRLHLMADARIAATTPELRASREAAVDSVWMIRLSGDNVQVTDSDFTTDCPASSVHGSNLVVARNHFHCTNSLSWHPGGGRNYLYEDNVHEGTCLGAGGSNVYFAHNVNHYNYWNNRELFTTDTGGGSFIGKMTSCDGVEVTLPEKVFRPVVGSIMAIMDGTGMGQYREIVAQKDTTVTQVTLDRPWDLPPDAASVLAIANREDHLLLIGNDLAEGGPAISIYGSNFDLVMADNTAARSTGYLSRGMNYNGPAPAFYIQWLNNRITEGYNLKSQEGGTGYGKLLLLSGNLMYVTRQRTFDWRGTQQRGVVVRGNSLEANASMGIQGLVTDVVMENNTIRNSKLGIESVAGGVDVVLRNNHFENVDRPLGPLGTAIIHPAEVAAIGLDGASRLLPAGAPAAWAAVRQKLVALQVEPLTAPGLLASVQACVNDAAASVPAGTYPFAFVQMLTGMEAGWALAPANKLLDSGKPGSANGQVALSVPAWAPPVEVATQLAALGDWQISSPAVAAPKPGGPAIGRPFSLNLPTPVWGVYALPVTYTVKGAGWTLSATDKLPLGSGAIREWNVVGPFPNLSGQAMDTTVHPPEQRLDLAATYPSPAGPLSWKPVSSPDGNLNLKELLGDGKMQVGYAVTVIRAVRPTPVQLTVSPLRRAVYVNRKLLIDGLSRWRTQTVQLEAGDNVIVCVACSPASDWSLSLQLQPLVDLAPGDLISVPAAEMAAVRALRSAAGQVAQGPGLPWAEGQDWKLVYANAFDWPRLGSEWLLDQGTLTVQDEALRVSGYWPVLVYRQPVPLPVRVEYDVRPMQTNDRRVLAVALTPAAKTLGRRLWGQVAGAGYFLALGWHDNLTNQVWREEKPVVVNDKGPFAATGKWQHVIVQFVAPSAKMYLDGKLALEYTDPQWLPNLDTVSLFNWPASTDLDNLRIYTAAN